MRHKQNKLFTVILFGIWLTGLQAQIMYVNETSGIQNAYALSDIRKMSFSSGDLTFTKTDNTNTVYALNGIRFLKFANEPTDKIVQVTNKSEDLSIYPNPVKDFMYVDLSDVFRQNCTLVVLNLQGQVLKTEQASIDGIVSMDLIKLPQGVYFCRFSNGTVIKTAKIIKQ